MIPLIEPDLTELEAQAAYDVIMGGFVNEGKLTKQFEERFAETVGTQYAVATTSCTTAIALALMALEIEESWKRENLVTPGLETRVTAMVPISSFSRWLEIRRKLEGIAVLARWDLVRMTTREAVADLWVQGDPEQLRLALAQSDLELIERPSFWILKPRDEDLPDAYKEIVLTPIPVSAPVAPPATTDQSAPLAAPVVPPKQ